MVSLRSVPESVPQTSAESRWMVRSYSATALLMPATWRYQSPPGRKALAPRLVWLRWLFWARST
ncbi:MAG: hypothetical protein H6703_12770 [Myxococcales bacterium]|nr:hypothetical protein [Myxococcales bacterium]